MQLRHGGLLVLAISGLFAVHAVFAADKQQARPVVGQDVLGDKSRSGPDGFTWAPLSRDHAALANGADAATGAAHDPRPGGQAGLGQSPGQDPGTPAAPAANGPGMRDVPANRRP